MPPRDRLELGTSACILLDKVSDMVKPKINKDRLYILRVVGGTGIDIPEGVNGYRKGWGIENNKAVCHNIPIEYHQTLKPIRT